MDLFFADPGEVPLPPAEVRIRELHVEPGPDGRRVRVYLEVEPFQRRPNAELAIFDRQENIVASVSVIETMNRKMEFTLHMRGAQPGPHTLSVEVYYALINEPAPEENVRVSDAIDRQVVDTRRVEFVVPSPEE